MTQAPRARVPRRPVHGVLLLDKPLGWSSNDVLQKVKWLLRAEKAGHTGTLDPLASGVLPLCFGAATKFSQLQLEADKTYRAVLQLGSRTGTGDAEGEVIERQPVPSLTAHDLQRVAAQFTGTIHQMPPMHSALKKDGRALYDYARAGITVERTARTLTVYELNMALTQEQKAQTAIELIVTCSKGTYIRTLGEDIAVALGCVGHLTALRRLATGGFDLGQSVTLAALESMTEPERVQHLLPVDALLGGHGRVVLSGDNAARFLNGLARRGPWPDMGPVAVYEQESGCLLGTGLVAAGELRPTRLLSAQEVEQMRQGRMAQLGASTEPGCPRGAEVH